MYNSHGVLELLLGNWEEFSMCPRLKGPNLLEIAALYADVETVKLLAETDRFRLKYDAKYSLREFAKRLTERVDVTNELIQAFDELLLIFNENPERPKSKEILVKKGLLEQHSALVTIYESEKAAADARRLGHESKCTNTEFSDAADDFEDAMENLHLMNAETGSIRASVTSSPSKKF